MSRHARTRQVCTQLLRASLTSPSSAALTVSGSYITGSGSGQITSLGAYQTRCYVAPRAKPAPRAPNKALAKSTVYNLEDISLQTFEGVVKAVRANENMPGVLESMSPAQYYEIAQRFAEAIKNGSSPWSVKLTGQNAVSASTLYSVGCLMRHIAEPRSAMAFVVAMWASASDMGYLPATISLAREISRGGAWGMNPQLKRVETRFKRLVSEGRDPNALTVEGELLYKLGKYDAAVTMLKRALLVGGEDFEWESSCRLQLGRAYVKLQRHVEAREAFEAVANMGSAEADADLGQLLRSSDQEKAEGYFYSAGIHGQPDMLRHLSEIALEKIATATDEHAAKDHQLWAMEWARLADLTEKF